jgi:N-methylhydantoinase A/oxoprolinase/acetone carboxylase beta subunit
MIDTAVMTEASVREAGIQAPLMIMRGDGGVMDIREMRRRPVMTMLSGPAASVAGALMHLRVSDGIYFEVGGTSTNIGVIRNGRPTVKYARVGGHETYVSSLDVRVIGIAGGSMVRVRDRRLVDVGPRSAHIAGLPYAAFANPEDIVEPRIELFQPKADDPDDYVAVRSANGTRYAITNTCAANVLGYAKPGLHAYGNPEAAQRAMAALADLIGKSIADTARAILDIATDKVIPVVDDLIAEYKLDRDQAVLVGEGGGAAALIPHAASRTGLHHMISKDAEVISSIGVALALVRDVVEANPSRSIRGGGQTWRRARKCRSNDRGRSAYPPCPRHRDGRLRDARPRTQRRGRRDRGARDRREGYGCRFGACDARRHHAADARVPGRGRGAVLADLHQAPQPGSGD